MGARFRTSEDHEPATELDPSSPTGERAVRSDEEEPNSKGMADYLAHEYESAWWGPYA